MAKTHGIPQLSSTQIKEVNALKQICDKYNNADESVTYSIEFNTMLEDATKLDLAQHSGLTEDLGYINLTLGNMCYNDKDYEQALIHYNSAAFYFSKLDTRSELVSAIQCISDTHYMLDQYAKVLEYNPIVLKYYQEINEQSKAADSNYYMAESYYQLNDYKNAAAYSLQALSYYEKVNDTTSMADTYQQIARIYFFDSNYTDSISFFKKSARMHQALKQIEDLTSDYLELGDAYYFDDQNKNAKSAYLEALNILKENGDLDKLKKVYNCLLTSCSILDEYAEAIDFGNKAIKLYNEDQSQHDLIDIYSRLGDTYYYQEDYSYALASYSEAEWRCSIYFEDVDDIQHKGQLNKDMSKCSYEMGDFDKAIKYLHEAIEINMENKFIIAMAENFRDLALTTFRGKKDPKSAYEYCDVALQMLNREDDLELRGEVYELIGDIQFDIKFHYGTDYYPISGGLDESLRKLKILQGDEKPDMMAIVLKSRIRSASITAYSKALKFYQKAGEEEMGNIVKQKINLVKEELK